MAYNTKNPLLIAKGLYYVNYIALVDIIVQKWIVISDLGFAVLIG